MHFQKGQSIVEFALVLPLFLFMVLGIIYFSMCFADYYRLNQIAGDCAREASLELREEDFSKIYARASGLENELISGIYVWHPSADGNNEFFSMVLDSDNKNVLVRVHADIDTDNSYIGQIYAAVLGAEDGAAVEFTHRMYCEAAPLQNS